MNNPSTGEANSARRKSHTGRFEIRSVPRVTTNLVKQIRYRWTDMYIFTGDRITSAFYAQNGKEIDTAYVFSKVD